MPALKIALLSLMLAGCVAERSVWLRADGKPETGPQIQLDKAACLGEVQKANMAPVYGGLAGAITRDVQANDVARGCMAEKGYLFVPESEVFKRTAASQ